MTYLANGTQTGFLSQVSHDSTLTGAGTPASPLSVVGGSGTTYQLPTGTVDGSNNVFIFAVAPKLINVD